MGCSVSHSLPRRDCHLLEEPPGGPSLGLCRGPACSHVVHSLFQESYRPVRPIYLCRGADCDVGCRRLLRSLSLQTVRKEFLMKNMALVPNIKELRKSRTGIRGLDEILGGGLPAGRSTLVCGGPGCGKTLLAMEFLVKGATEFGEPGVFMAFEETAEELTENVASLGFDLQALIARNLLLIQHVQLERYELEEAGEYDLEGLFIRLDHAIDASK